MTDGRAGAAEWLPALRRASRKAAHETRNALNAVAVNLEVVKSVAERRSGAPADALPFLRDAAVQVERVTALAEAVHALNLLLVHSVQNSQNAAGAMFRARIGEAEAARATKALQALSAAAILSANQDGPDVILRFPNDRAEKEAAE